VAGFVGTDSSFLCDGEIKKQGNILYFLMSYGRLIES
jgi:hypothetical protein